MCVSTDSAAHTLGGSNGRLNRMSAKVLLGALLSAGGQRGRRCSSLVLCGAGGQHVGGFQGYPGGDVVCWEGVGEGGGGEVREGMKHLHALCWDPGQTMKEGGAVRS